MPPSHRSSYRASWSMRVTASALIVSLLAGCAGGNQLGPNATAVDRANANFGQTVATGAVSGAVVGAILGAVVDRGNRGQGAALGALAGGALGAGAGTVVANNNVNQARTEDTLQQQIQDAQNQASLANAAATEAQHRAAEAVAQSPQLLAQYRAGKITSAQYHQQLTASEEYGQQLQQLVGNISKREDVLRQQVAAAGNNSEDLRKSLAQIETSRQSLQSSQAELYSATAAVPQS